MVVKDAHFEFDSFFQTILSLHVQLDGLLLLLLFYFTLQFLLFLILLLLISFYFLYFLWWKDRFWLFARFLWLDWDVFKFNDFISSTKVLVTIRFWLFLLSCIWLFIPFFLFNRFHGRIFRLCNHCVGLFHSTSCETCSWTTSGLLIRTQERC